MPLSEEPHGFSLESGYERTVGEYLLENWSSYLYEIFDEDNNKSIFFDSQIFKQKIAEYLFILTGQRFDRVEEIPLDLRQKIGPFSLKIPYDQDRKVSINVNGNWQANYKIEKVEEV